MKAGQGVVVELPREKASGQKRKKRGERWNIDENGGSDVASLNAMADRLRSVDSNFQKPRH